MTYRIAGITPSSAIDDQLRCFKRPSDRFSDLREPRGVLTVAWRAQWAARFDELDKVVAEMKQKEKTDGRKK